MGEYARIDFLFDPQVVRASAVWTSRILHALPYAISSQFFILPLVSRDSSFLLPPVRSHWLLQLSPLTPNYPGMCPSCTVMHPTADAPSGGDSQVFDGAPMAEAGMVLLAFFLCVMNVTLLNLLIAILATAHARVEGNADKEAVLSEAIIITQYRSKSPPIACCVDGLQLAAVDVFEFVVFFYNSV